MMNWALKFNKFTPFIKNTGKEPKLKLKKFIFFARKVNSTMHVNYLKVMKRFLFNGHTIGFQPQIQKLQSAYTVYNSIQ